MWGVRFADFISVFLKYPMEMKKFGLTETKLFHFHRIFKKLGPGREVQANPLKPFSGSTTVITGECSWSSSGTCNATCCVAPQRGLTYCNETDHTANVETKACTYGACAGKTVNPVYNGQSQKDRNWNLRPIIV